MNSQMIVLLSDLRKCKRNLSFYNNEFIQVCSGLNFEANCSYSECKAARSMGGLVEIQYPGMMSCNYHEVVPSLKCPFCHNGLPPDRVKGIVFVRCKVLIGFGEETVEFRVRGEQTVLWELPCDGSEIQVILLHKDPEPQTVSELSLDGAHNPNTNLMHSTLNGFPDIVQSYRYIHQQQLVPPQEQHVPPQEQHVPPQEQHVPPQQQHVPPQEQHVPPQEQHVPPQEQHVLPQEQHVPPQEQHVPPQEQHVLPQEQHVPPQEQHVPPQEQHVPPQEQHVPPQQQHVPPQQQHVPPQEQHVPPQEQHVPPQEQHVPPQEQHVPPQQQHVPPQQQHVPPQEQHVPPQEQHVPPQEQHVPPQEQHVPPQQQHVPPQEQHVPPQQQHVPPQQQHVPPQEQHVPPQEQHVPPQQQHVPPQQQHVPPQEQHVPPQEQHVQTHEDEEELSSQLDLMFAELIGNSTELATDPGMNLLAKCSNSACPSNAEGLRHICIGVGAADPIQYRHLIADRICPSCNQPIPLTAFRGILLCDCRAKVVICGEEQMLVADQDPVGHWIGTNSPDMEITVLDRIITPPHLRPISQNSNASFGRILSHDKFYARVGIGLNLEARCRNPICDATYVTIPCPDTTEGDYSALIKGIACPGCERVTPPSSFTGISLLKCKAEIRVGDTTHILTAEGKETTEFKIDLEGPEVHIQILKQEVFSSDELSVGHTAVSAGAALCTSGEAYTTVCNGVNFIGYCKDNSCQANIENNGQVIVKRDEQFIERNGFSADCCDYNAEIQCLLCPSCGNPLDRNNIDGVSLVRCKGTIESNGKCEPFVAAGNNLRRYESDELHATAQISFELDTIRSKVTSFSPEKGLNLRAKCSNTNCPSQSTPLQKGIVNCRMIEVMDCRLQSAVHDMPCPRCHQSIPLCNFKAMILTECTARVRSAEGITSYILGDELENFPFSLKSDPVIDILPVQARQILSEPDGSPYTRMKRGMNLMTICPNDSCTTEGPDDGTVIIPFPYMRQYTYNNLLENATCPHCHTSLAGMELLSLSFLHCRAEICVGEERFVIRAGNGEAIDFKPDSSASDVTIHLMKTELTS